MVDLSENLRNKFFIIHCHLEFRTPNELMRRHKTHLPTDVQKCWWAFIVFKHLLLRISQHRIERSSLAEIRYLPPG